MSQVLSRAGVALVLCMLLFNTSGAQDAARPLTLEAALATVEAAHPDFLLAQADRDAAVADRDIAASRTDSSINLEGVLRSGSQPAGSQQYLPDNSIRLTARKTLYDFGRSSAAEQASVAELNAREADLITARERRRLEVMSRYFEVLIADMQYTIDNELMAVHYVRFDHGKENFTAGKISSVDLAELETNFQDTLQKRNTSSQKVRITRAILANAMNRPGNLPGELVDPKLESNNRKLPEYESLLSIMLLNNPRLIAQREMLAASQRRLESVRAEKGPTLEAEVQAADFSRPAISRDNLSAGLILTWPLHQGNRSDSRIARELAQLNKFQAASEKLTMDMTQAMLETYLEIVELQGAGRSSAQKQAEHRDLVLERSRGLYELELRSNLGTSSAGTIEASLRMRRNEYQLALGFARLEAMLGQPLESKGSVLKPVNEMKGTK